MDAPVDLLKKLNDAIAERKFHLHTYILHNLRTFLNKEHAVYVEIGSYVGSSARLMLSHPLSTKVYCIDPCHLDAGHFGGTKSQYDTLYDNCKQVGDTFHIIAKKSTDPSVYDDIKDTPIDILFIDGDHSFDGVVSDWNTFSPLVADGGYIVFDDYCDAQFSPEVRPAVDHIVKGLDTKAFEVIGSLPNIQNIEPPANFSHLNEFIIRKRPSNLFAIVIPTYKRANGKTPQHLRNVAAMLDKQTCTNYKVFLIGDHYEDEDEFNSFASLFPGAYCHNNPTSYRTGYFKERRNCWAIGGIMAIEHGVKQAQAEGFQYYLHLDDDDTWDPEKLEVLRSHIYQFPHSDFIFHGSNYLDTVLPREHATINSVGYNNLMPWAENIVHSAMCLRLDAVNYAIWTKFIQSKMIAADDIKSGRIPEYTLYPFDAHLVKYLRYTEGINYLYIPQVLSSKLSDCNVP